MILDRLDDDVPVAHGELSIAVVRQSILIRADEVIE